MYLKETGSRGVDWINLALDRDQWRCLVNTVMNLGLHKMLGNSSVSERLAASHGGLCSIELVTSHFIQLT
jgi:hypothetical protein